MTKPDMTFSAEMSNFYVYFVTNSVSRGVPERKFYEQKMDSLSNFFVSYF